MTPIKLAAVVIALLCIAVGFYTGTTPSLMPVATALLFWVLPELGKKKPAEDGALDETTVSLGPFIPGAPHDRRAVETGRQSRSVP